MPDSLHDASVIEIRKKADSNLELFAQQVDLPTKTEPLIYRNTINKT